MPDRKSGKSKKKHKEQAEKINLREAADALKAAERKIVPIRAAKIVEPEIAEITYAPEQMVEPTPEKVPASRALVPAPKMNGEDAADSLQQSLEAAQKTASAVNAKLMDMAQEAMNASLEHARDLAGATNPMQALKLQMSYWQETIESFAAHAEQLRTLTAELVAASSEPIRAHLRAQAAKR
jgi:hypothetical protein